MKYAKWRRRLRGISKWGGVFICLVIVVAFAASLRWQMSIQRIAPAGSTTYGVGLQAGGISLLIRDLIPQPPPHVEIDSWIGPVTRQDLCLWVDVWEDGLGPLIHFWEVDIPLWLPFLLIALPTGFLFWSDRRRRMRAGCCGKCGYDLTGNSSGKCPECGATTPARAAT